MQSLSILSENLCSYNASSSEEFIGWESMEWNTLGRSVSNETMEDKAFCYHKEYKILRMPLKWSWNNGNHVCKKVGQMYGDFSSLEYLIRKLTFGNLEDCQFIWTSYKYIADNKTIINQNNKEIIDYKYD